MGVVFARFADDDKIIEVAKNSERNLESEVLDVPAVEPVTDEAQTGKDESVDE
jgi:DNA gyrase subunit A